MGAQLDCQLSAMDGMSHAAFRSICFEYGAAAAATEMIPALQYARARARSAATFAALTARRPEERCLYAQIIDCDAEMMALAAKKLSDSGRFDGIEINMGCPARCVVGGGKGAALLQEPERAEEILRAVRAATGLTLRLKLRLGWDDMHITAPEIARRAQDCGVDIIVLHGRTRSQMYKGEVNIEAMRRVCQAVAIPVLANGAVKTAADARPFMEACGAAGVCIGRAALRAPWIFADIGDLEAGREPRSHDAPERIDLLVRLAQRLCALKPEKFAILEMRKYCEWLLSGFANAQQLIDRVNKIGCLAAFTDAMQAYSEQLVQAGDIKMHPELEPKPTLDTLSSLYKSAGN